MTKHKTNSMAFVVIICLIGLLLIYRWGGAEGEVREIAWCVLLGSVWEPAAIFPVLTKSHAVFVNS